MLQNLKHAQQICLHQNGHNLLNFSLAKYYIITNNLKKKATNEELQGYFQFHQYIEKLVESNTILDGKVL